MQVIHFFILRPHVIATQLTPSRIHFLLTQIPFIQKTNNVNTLIINDDETDELKFYVNTYILT